MLEALAVSQRSDIEMEDTFGRNSLTVIWQNADKRSDKGLYFLLKCLAALGEIFGQMAIITLNTS